MLPGGLPSPSQAESDEVPDIRIENDDEDGGYEPGVELTLF